MSFEWENGRILKKINTSDKSVQMSYDSNGMRTQKSVDGVKTNYYYDSNKNLISLVKGNDTLLFSMTVTEVQHHSHITVQCTFM